MSHPTGLAGRDRRQHRPRALALVHEAGSGARTAWLLFAITSIALLIVSMRPATAMQIQKVKSPGGVEAWLVQEHSVPLIAFRFAFQGGSAQDPDGKDGVANFLTGMMDEGAGELRAAEFQEQLEELAVRMRFEDGRDFLYGDFETLTVNRDAAVDLVRLAITRPRFDVDAIERVRRQLLANLDFAEKDPDKIAGKTWRQTAFPNHPYGRPSEGTKASVAAITRDDLEGYRKRTFARGSLKVAVVGDIDAATLGPILDRLFGELPAQGDLRPIPKVSPVIGGAPTIVEMDVPQSVAVFGHGGIDRKDPDYIPAYVVNHILGGGSFASRLMEEVREKRGLAYGVYSYLQPQQQAAIFAGSVATKNEAIAQSLDVIKAELKRMADSGPTAVELENAKNYLIGSYALRFDTNSKIASQLLAIQQDDLGIDYVDRRNAEVAAVTLDDVKRVARRLLKVDELLVTVVGKPKNLAGRP